MTAGLRVVAFNVVPLAYQLVAAWAERNGHQIVLLITSPAGERYNTTRHQLIEAAPRNQDILITTRLRRTAAPVIAALAPDLIVSATFPHRIPPEVTAIPRLGAVNLHPAPLPRGRGPNPQRMIYEGDLTVAGTLHRIVPEFDAGPILSQHLRQLPADITPELILRSWLELVGTALEEGTRRAAAGELGDVQDESLATYCAPFTAEEYWLSWAEPALTVQRRAAALNLVGPAARAHLDRQPVVVSNVRSSAGAAPDARPGTVIERTGDHAVIRVADGMVEATVQAIS